MVPLKPGLPLAQRDDYVKLPLPHWMKLEAGSELQAWEEVLLRLQINVISLVLNLCE